MAMMGMMLVVDDDKDGRCVLTSKDVKVTLLFDFSDPPPLPPQKLPMDK
jgi:hypothetical protein